MNKIVSYILWLTNGFIINVRNILRKVSSTELLTFPTASPAIFTTTTATGDNNSLGSRLPSVQGSGSELVNPITDSHNSLGRRSTTADVCSGREPLSLLQQML